MISVIIVSSVGLLISVYFALVYHGLMKPDSGIVPSVCRMDEESCQSVLKVREARVFGIPNFYLGIVFYLAIIAFSLNPDQWKGSAVGAHIASGVAVVVSLYLAYSLLFLIKKKCVLCFTAHILNLIIFFLLSL